MFHVKQTINKTFDAQPLKKGCIKCFAVKVKTSAIRETKADKIEQKAKTNGQKAHKKEQEKKNKISINLKHKK